MTPQPWPRTGPGTAKDGKPKFDLSRFDPAYFNRLRHYVIAAANEGIYVSVMLFEGFGLHLSLPPDNVEGHPFHAANNVNGIGIDSINDYQVLPLDPRVQALQDAYIRKVIDTVQDQRTLRGRQRVLRHVEDHGNITFTAPFAEAGPTVLYLKGVEG